MRYPGDLGLPGRPLDFDSGGEDTAPSLVFAEREPKLKLRAALSLLALCTFGCDSTPTAPSPKSCTYVITPLQFTPCMAPSQGTVSVLTEDGCPWTPSAGASWIALAGTGARSGTGTLGFTVTENYVAPRESVIGVHWPAFPYGQSIRVAQAGCLYTLVPASIVVQATGTDGSFDVWQMAMPNDCGGPLQDRCVWSAQPDKSWITILSSPGRGDGRVGFRVGGNDSPTSRTGTIAVRDKQFEVTQAGR